MLSAKQVLDASDETRRRPRVRTVNTDPDLCVQSQGMQTEIRHILEKYNEVGILPHMRQVDLEFRDVTEFEDFADMMRQTKVAEAAFMKLPPQVRDVFEHDVMKWLDAAHDPEKLEALRPALEKVGAMKPKDVPLEKSVDGRLVNRRKSAELAPNPALVDRRRKADVVAAMAAK